MYKIYYDCVNPKYGKKSTQLCYIEIGNFLVYLKTEDIYNVFSDVEIGFYTLNYELQR